jgi:hypothetical protein
MYDGFEYQVARNMVAKECSLKDLQLLALSTIDTIHQKEIHTTRLNAETLRKGYGVLRCIFERMWICLSLSE